jgi:saccharopine dehydrogenase (NADP+, L-glutamate forming)
MTRVLVIGAGKSTPVLIDYLLEQATLHDWQVLVADRDLDLARLRVADNPRGEAMELDVDDETARDRLIADSQLVVSMLPPNMHGPIAEACIDYGSHFVSASYVSPEIRDLDEVAEKAGVTMLNEVGVDPGIDHMSAMETLDGLRGREARITTFETFTGGLVAPESDDNPWRYKFTWNPRNVVLAGQGGVRFKHHGRFKYIPYHRLFKRFERLEIPGFGEFEGYPNRDSLKYRHAYGLRGVDTIYRGTLRRPGFCDAWDCLVQLGLTDDKEVLEGLGQMTYRDFVNAFLWYDPAMSVELKVRAYLKLDLNAPEFDKLEWLGLFEKAPIGLRRTTAARVLQQRLEEKWALGPDDQDMIAMLHKIEYELDGKTFREQSSMVTLGSDSVRTAMAKTVGLTAAIGARLILDGTIRQRGVQIPTSPEVYRPLLAELRKHGIVFDKRVEEVE